MSIQITTWLRAFFALQTNAMESRGFVEEETDVDDFIRWPRTNGADVVAIAAVVDPYLRSQPLRFGGQGVARRWRAVVDDLEQHALIMPLREYAENRSFWNTLPALFVYLHSEGAPLPDLEIWEALFDLLADTSELRNVGPKGDGPFKHFDDIKTFDDLYRAQYKHMRETRGVDDDKRTSMPVPRSTNAEVVQLADYWSKQFGGVKEVFGHAGAVQRWKAALVNVDAVARKGDPNAVYPHNVEFWPALKNTAIHTAVADEAPTKWDMALDSIKTSVKNLPENIKGGATKAADALASAAGGIAQNVGKIANEAGRGLFSGFGTPMLIGAGLLGVYLVSRNRSTGTKEA